MKFVLISDTHSKHKQIKVPEGDILIHAGDLTSMGYEHEVLEVFNWFKTLSKQFKHIIFIAGNHDLSFQRKNTWLEIMLEDIKGTNIHYLEDTAITLEGINFYGSPWQPEFHSWAFNAPRGEKLAQIWSKIPDNTDVLITHGPPQTILDTSGSPWNVPLLGCEELLTRVNQVKPKFHVFGHIHGGYGMVYNGNTYFVNAAVCTEQYVPSNYPITFDY